MLLKVCVTGKGQDRQGAQSILQLWERKEEGGGGALRGPGMAEGDYWAPRLTCATHLCCTVFAC